MQGRLEARTCLAACLVSVVRYIGSSGCSGLDTIQGHAGVGTSEQEKTGKVQLQLEKFSYNWKNSVTTGKIMLLQRGQRLYKTLAWNNKLATILTLLK